MSMPANFLLTLGLAAILASGSLIGTAAAQSVTLKTYCEINLKDANLNQYARGPEATTGSVFTFNATKKCTNSRSSQTINLNCTAGLTNWIGGNRSAKNFTCKISGEQCGLNIGAAPIKANLVVTSTGPTTATASLTCQFNRNR